MRAGIYLGKEQIEIRELPLPDVGERVYPYPLDAAGAEKIKKLLTYLDGGL